jgi:hypothetical protein
MYPFTEKKNTYVDDQIVRITVKLQHLEIDSKEYREAVELLSTLQKIRQEEKPNMPSSDTMLTIGANLLGIILILRHEHLNVITSKAVSFVPKLK